MNRQTSPQRLFLTVIAGVLAVVSFVHTVSEAYKDGMDEAAFALGGIVSALMLVLILIHQEKRRLADAQRAMEAADARLESANRRMVEAVEAVSEGFALFDADDRLIHCNRHYRNLYALTTIREGMTFEDLIRDGARKGQYSACPNGDIEPWIAERLAQHRNPGSSFEQELQGGRWLRVSEWRTSDGGYVGIRTDITEHKRREAELADKTELLETVFAAMNQGVAVWSADGRLLTWNRRFSELLDLPPGWLRPGLTKRDMLLFLAERGEFGPDTAEMTITERLKTLEPSFTTSNRTEYQRPNGTVLERTVAPVAGGRTMLVSYTDITAFRRVETELRESEERFRQLSDAATDAIVMHEAGIVMDANTAACTLLGLDTDQLVGRPVLSMIAPEDMAKASQRLRTHMESPFELTCRRPDGTRFLVEGRTRYVSHHGRLVGIVSARDITETRRVQEQMRIAKEQAELANKAKSEFLRTISHEIRTPMNGVLGTLGLLLDGELDEQQRIYATTARESGEALLAILNDILDLSKMEAGKLVLEEHRFHLVELVEGVVELLSARATAKGITLAACVPAQVPPLLRGDAGRLRQILLNLAGNAVKFTESGGVSVSVELAAPDTGAGDGSGTVHLHFRIADTGIGIAPDALPSLFTEFTQVDPQPSRRHGGTGLGLAICKRLVQLMGGRISVESTLGRGSVFWFTVPLHRQPGDAAGSGADLATRMSGRRVLLLDPCAIGRDAMAAQLRSWGAQVDATGDAATALRHAGANPIDAALVDGDDRTLPNLIGALRGAGVRRIIRLTMVGQHSEALPAGTDALVVKPVRQRRLLEVLEGKPGDQAHPCPRPAHPSPATAPGRRLLLAEDSPTNQLVAASFLKAAGYQVDVAANGLEALEAARTLPYDVILMDLAMPEMDGLTAARTLRTMPSPIGQIPIIAMTADAMPGDRDRCLAAGMNDYVPKPVDRTLLLDTVARWLPATPSAQGPAAGGQDGEGAERLDAAVLKQLTDDLEASLLTEVIHQFMEETRTRARRIAETTDPKQLSRDAHTLKSTAATFGAMVLSAHARALEDACRNGPAEEVERLRARVPDLVEAAADAYRATGLLS